MLRTTKHLLILMSLLTVLFCFCSCGGENEDVWQNAIDRGFTCKVTYELGSGTSNGKSTLYYMVRPGSTAPELGVTQGTGEPILKDHTAVGYYYTDANGNEVAWDIKNDTVSSDIVLTAKWERNYAIRIRYGEGNESAITITVLDGMGALETLREPKWEGHTFYGFYADAEYTEPIVFPYEHSKDPENRVETVYAKFLDGSYTIVREPQDFKKTINAGGRYYIDADIDMTGEPITLPTSFVGKIIGNGHTIKGLTVELKQTKNSEAYGLFGSIGATAELRDVTFEDAKVTVLLDNAQNNKISHIGLLGGSVAEGATFENVTVTGELLYNTCQRDLTGLLVIGEAFGEGESDGVTATVQVKEITAEEAN